MDEFSENLTQLNRQNKIKTLKTPVVTVDIDL